MELIDVHAHLQFPEFDGDREMVIKRTLAAGIGVINVGTDEKTSEAAVKLAEENEGIFAIVGLHPTDAARGFDPDFFEDLARHPKVVGIGECGLDYGRDPKSLIREPRQEEIFGKQIELALAVDKPLMLHIRNAYADALAVIDSRRHPRLRGNVHFFSGDWPTARRFLDRGFTLSFAGPITFSPRPGQPRVAVLDEVVKNMPLDMILAETDCPFAAPVPFRGRRNEPLYLKEIVSRIASLKGLSLVEASASLKANARRVFNLSIA